MKFCCRVMRMSAPARSATIGDGDHLVARDEAEVHRHADVAEPRLLLGVDAQVVARGELGRRQVEVGERAAEPLLDALAHALGADVVDHELETRLDAADPVVEVGGPGARDRRQHLDGLVLGHEDAQLLGDARHRRETAADQHAEPLLPLVHRPDERDAVDLGRVVAVGRGRDRVLVLARQVGEVGVAVEELGRLLDGVGAIEQLERIDALHRRPGDVAHGVATAAGGRDARRVELCEHVGQALQGQVVQLHVLTCRKLADTLAEAVRDLADRAQLGRLDEPGRQLDAQHERADLGLVVVQPPPLEAHDVLLGDRLVAGGYQRRQLVADAEWSLVALDALDGIALEDEVPIGLGSFSARSHGRAHGYLLTACSCRPCGMRCMHGVARKNGGATRVLAQTTDARALFQACANSCVRTARWGGTTPLNARHPPSRSARRVWHLAQWAGCRGVIGPEPSTSPDVERTRPLPPGSISHPGGRVVRACGRRRAAKWHTRRVSFGRSAQGNRTLGV